MAGKGGRGVGRSDRTHIHGTRFDASISADRKNTDIKDLEHGNIVTMLDMGNLEELAVIAGDAQAGVPWAEVPTSRFRASGHPDRDGVDLFDLRDRKRLTGLDRVSLEELQLLSIELIGMMTAIPRNEAWRKWFPDHKVPRIIQDMVQAGLLRDTTWEHDAAPNFDAILSSGEILTLWVEHPNTNLRSSMDTRYGISIAEPGSRAGEAVLESDDVVEIVSVFRALLKELGGPRGL